MDYSLLLLEANAELESGNVAQACGVLEKLYSGAWMNEEVVPLLGCLLAVAAMLSEADGRSGGSIPPAPVSVPGNLRDWCRDYVCGRARMDGAAGRIFSRDCLGWGLARVEDELAAAGWVVDRAATPPLDFAVQGLVVESTRETGRMASVSDLHEKARELRREFEKLTPHGNAAAD